jgi:segregation and condensation protein A
MARPLLGRDVFTRGAPEGLATIDQPIFELSLYELLKAYGDSHRRQHGQVLTILPSAYRSLADAMEHLRRFVGHVPDWRKLMAFLPDELRAMSTPGPLRKSALAAMFAATLELVKAGQAELRQDRAFGPLYLRSGGGVRPE